MTCKLYGFGESGHTYKVALTLTFAGVEWEPVFVDFFAGETRSPQFRAINVMGECPVLVDGDETLTQSGMIQTYLAEKTGKLGGQTDAEKREVLRWLLFDNHKVSAVAGPVRFLRNFLPEEKRKPDAIAFMQGRLLSALKVLEQHLEGREWVATDELTIADLALCSYLYFEEPFGFERPAFPAISAWLDRIAATPGWNHPYGMLPRALRT